MSGSDLDLFKDKFAKDVATLYAVGKFTASRPERVADRILRRFAAERADPKSGPILYMSLALLLIDSQVRDHPVLREAGEIVRTGRGLEYWREDGPKAAEHWRRIYAEVEKILAEAAEGKAEAESSRKAPRPARVGDLLEIPLADGRYAYGHYLFRDRTFGAIVQVFDCVTEQPVEPESLGNCGPLFPPVIVGLASAIKAGRWRVVGKKPVEQRDYPKFRMGFLNTDGKVRVWRIWDGEKETIVGAALPPDYRNLEMIDPWHPILLERRIQNGGHPRVAQYDWRNASV